jgi:tRNA(adenine34) deaminase
MAADQDMRWMGRALNLAMEAKAGGEVPVGAVITRDGDLLGEGRNCSISMKDPTGHAEIAALRSASQTVGNYRLLGVTLYVSLEPCLMCIGAMIHARIKRLVFGAYDIKSGAAGSVFSVLGSGGTNHTIEVLGGVRESECAEVLRSFFAARRRI